MTSKNIILFSFLLLALGFVYYLLRPLNNIPDPAEFHCLDMSEGSYIPMDSISPPGNIYAMGLTYRDHLVETAAEFDPDVLPPIFKKKHHALTRHETQVRVPKREKMIAAVKEMDPAAAEKLRDEFEHFSPLLDYEVELGFVLLEDINRQNLEDEDYIPLLGYFIANDLSARSVGLLGEGMPDRYDYWGLSKSFPGFLPVSDKIWIPQNPGPASIPCVRLETLVNGEVRQSLTTDNMIYTPKEMLGFILKKYPDASLNRGDLVLTGTGGGVAIATPRALVRLSYLLGFDRFRKLKVKLRGDHSRFLKAGDIVEIRSQELGVVQNKLVAG